MVSVKGEGTTSCVKFYLPPWDIQKLQNFLSNSNLRQLSPDLTTGPMWRAEVPTMSVDIL